MLRLDLWLFYILLTRITKCIFHHAFTPSSETTFSNQFHENASYMQTLSHFMYKMNYIRCCLIVNFEGHPILMWWSLVKPNFQIETLNQNLKIKTLILTSKPLNIVQTLKWTPKTKALILTLKLEPYTYSKIKTLILTPNIKTLILT
jgi:hypothetical protein